MTSFGFQRASPLVGQCALGFSPCVSTPGSNRVSQTAHCLWVWGHSRMTTIAREQECTGQLARFFPKLPSVRIPVRITPLRPGQLRVQEATVVEFGTGEFAIFLSKLALEFDDRVRLVRDGGGRPAEAAVIALQYQEGSKAVAVRFLDCPCEWMMHP
jgi:hypothetical protein